MGGAGRRVILMREYRFDERQPGHGITLLIAVKFADIFGGSHDLEVSDLGGPRICLALSACANPRDANFERRLTA